MRFGRIITPGAAVLCAVSLFISSWALSGWFNSAQARRADDARAWHVAICYLEEQVIAAPQLSAERKAKSLRVYEHILTLVNAERCHT